MLKFLHTADWHLGQMFQNYERFEEHDVFLNWLKQIIVQHEIDVLLISGDVFDHAHPNIRSVRAWYQFLSDACELRRQLQIIVIAGNHDSAIRLESPQPLLDENRIRIIGVVSRDENGEIPLEQFWVPIKDENNQLKAYCLAIPFLRMGDFLNNDGVSISYSEGVEKMYLSAYQYYLDYLDTNIPVVAMGHLHALNAEVGEDENNVERQIMGGAENIKTSSFHPDVQYVALGHIHKSQRIGGKEHIRYSGSPIPMSFSEINYRHRVLTFELNGRKVQNIEDVFVPIHTMMIQVPQKPIPLDEVLNRLSQLEDTRPDTAAPYLEVKVLLTQPEPTLRFSIENVLKGKHVKLAKISITKSNSDNNNELIFEELKELEQLNPNDVFERIFVRKFNTAPSKELNDLFVQAYEEAQNID
ncbi:MAG: exonuclease SbcCD subunit D C-terminal domain-containing protein [Chitinophagales bacterium]|nr:exonuclease SbcCD subunit D C-terminal domain-containing protein [Chitinophagales bacterium]